jgi:hypothetical protein
LLVNSSVHTRATPLPPRAMLLSQIHAFDYREYEPADIAPYLLPASARTLQGPTQHGRPAILVRQEHLSLHQHELTARLPGSAGLSLG